MIDKRRSSDLHCLYLTATLLTSHLNLPVFATPFSYFDLIQHFLTMSETKADTKDILVEDDEFEEFQAESTC